jgi:hypothetical protein
MPMISQLLVLEIYSLEGIQSILGMESRNISPVPLEILKGS